MRRDPVRPDRVRAIDQTGFAFISNRYLRDGFFSSLETDERELYTLLLLAGDRRGMSFMHHDTICAYLQMRIERYVEARNGLVRKDLIAIDGAWAQVLSLPHAPATAPGAWSPARSAPGERRAPALDDVGERRATPNTPRRRTL